MKRVLSIGALIAVVSLSSTVAGQPVGAEAQVRYDGHRVARVTIRNVADFQRVSNLATSVWTHTPRVGGVDFQFSPEQFAALPQLGLPFRVTIEDVQGLIDAERAEIAARAANRGLTWFENYKTLAQINSYMDDLATAHPELVTVESLGNSLNGNPIRAMRITGPDSAEYPRANRPQVIFHGCQHAREWVSPMTNMYIADQLVEAFANDPRVSPLLKRCEILIVPVVNPDGYLYTWSNNRLWRKNRRNNGNGTIGVDNNRNWGYQWGGEGASTNPGDETYRGTAAFSEPETQRLRDYILANPRIVAHIDYHSFSQLILSPWGYTMTLPPDAVAFDVIGRRMQAEIGSPFGSYYEEGPVYTTIYPASGGSNDWTYGAGSTQYKIFGFSIELRDTGDFGFELPPDQIIPTGRENLPGALALAEAVTYPVHFSFPEGLPTEIEAGETAAFRVSITANPRNTLDTGSIRLLTRAAGGSVFTESALVNVGGGVYEGTFPAALCGDSIEYYIEAANTLGSAARSPSGAPEFVYSVEATQTSERFADACETNTGWVVGAAGDNASAGLWGLSDPQATSAQPADDHTPVGTNCWMTDGRAGSADGTYDVDGGTTTLTSPAFDASVPSGSNQDAVVTYWRWYSNDRGSNPNQDSMPVMISNDNGSTWTQLELVTENANSWVKKSFRIADHVTPTASMKLRFIARDLGGGSLVEAGVDDVQVALVGCSCLPADFNCDGFITGEDYDLYVQAFEAGDTRADFDGDGFITGADFDQYVAAFEGG